MAFPAFFALAVGLGIIGQWTAAYQSGQIPELVTEPVRIRFHLAAELATALALILGAIGLLASQSWGRPLYLISLGMLLYTVIISPGYFAQQGQWKWVGAFAILFVLAILSLRWVW